MTDHRIAYTGRLGSGDGYRWYCICGARSDEPPWGYRWERTMEAHRHLDRVRQQTSVR